MMYYPEGYGRRGDPPLPGAVPEPPKQWPTHYLLILLRRDGTRRLVKSSEPSERVFDYENGVTREYWRQGPFPGEEIVAVYKES